MIPVSDLMSSTLAEILRRAPLSDDKIAFAWRTAVGSAMSRGTKVTFEEGILRVTADGPAWAREVERSEALIRSRLDALLGRGIVGAIQVVSQDSANRRQNK